MKDALWCSLFEHMLNIFCYKDCRGS